MPSLFNRVRTSSAKTLQSTTRESTATYDATPQSHISVQFDEFGQERTQSSFWPDIRTSAGFKSKTTPRQRTLSAPSPPKDFLREVGELPPLPLREDTFHPLYIPATKREEGERPYGYLCAENGCILGLEELDRLVSVVCKQISERAVDTALLFSAQALDISSHRVKSLVRSFLSACTSKGSEPKWKDDARLAGPHELGFILRWGLSRVLRLVGEQPQRGLLEWETYVQWKLDEEAHRFPANHFTAFIDLQSPTLQPILTTLFSTFSILAAHSSQSGLTPIALSTLFGPLLFGLGQSDVSSPFSQVYASYLRSSHATEHLLLSHIRRTELEGMLSASPIPTKLKDWIRGYPIMIPPLRDLEKPRRGCKLVQIASARRNVRLYSPDLVKTGASWAGGTDLALRPEWRRMTPNGPPTYTDTYRKRLDIPMSYAPSLLNFDSRTSLDTEEGEGMDGIGMSNAPSTFRSLTDMQWGQFEEAGFGSPDSKKLQFDLNEGARLNRTQKRQSMNWTDFSAIGFSEATPLSETLQFDTPLASSINTWPQHEQEIHRKLKKTQKVLPAFGWDTAPVAGPDWTVEEGFVGCWADLLLSAGWMNRSEGTFRASNWALVEFKALPLGHNPDDFYPPHPDPRTASQYFLFEEFVPQEYRDELIHPPKKTAKTLFAGQKGKGKTWKPATTLNGKPYTGRPRSPDAREAEFDAMLRTGSQTKLISLTGAPRPSPVKGATAPAFGRKMIPDANNYGISSSTPRPLYAHAQTSPPVPIKDRTSALARFKIAGSGKKNIASEYDPDLDFETKTASDSSGGETPTGRGRKHDRRESKDDAWVDILVSDRRRLAGQEAVMSNKNGSAVQTLNGNGYDADLMRTPDLGIDPVMLRTPRESLTRSHSDPDIGQAAKAIIASRPTHGYFDKYGAGRASRTYTEDDEEEEVMEVPRASYIEATRPEIRIDPAAERGYFNHRQEESGSSYRATGSDFEPALTPTRYQQDDVEIDSRPVSGISYARPESELTASPMSGQDDLPPSPRVRKPAPGSGVGSLVEMYAKKDEEASRGIYEPKASRLPVRAGSGGSGGISPSTSPQPAAISQPQASVLPPPPAIEDPINRMLNPSPGRYVHGAPLHNVLEEGSEEG